MAEQQKPHEVLIEDRLYDVSQLKHPGGSILKFYQGTGDATEAFREFHRNSKKAKKMLNALPNRPAPTRALTKEEERHARMTMDLAKLQQELTNEGWYKASPAHIAYRWGEIIGMHLFGAYLLATPYWVLGLVILGIVQGRCGWLMHEGGHNSLTTNIKLDRRMQEVLYGFGCGMSGAWWRSQHNKHHAAPQKLKHDVDLDTLPLVAFNGKIAKLAQKSLLARTMITIQAYIFAPITCTLVTFQWQFFLHLRHMFRTSRYVEMASVAVRWLTIFALARHFDLTVGQALACYTFYCMVGGTYIFVNFALSHTHLPVADATDNVHWMEYGAKYTINISNTWMVNWWMGYLNFQIEHHLFPTMPQYRFPLISRRVKALFEKHGLRYDCRPYFSAMYDTFHNLNTVSEVFNTR